jgi:uncharacterized protein YlxW (UPF0749 family)
MVETRAPVGPPPEHVTVPLLALITQRSLDADYEHVAARRRAEGTAPPRSVPRRTAGVVLLVFGLLVTIAAVQTSRNASVDEASRASLIDQIGLRRQNLAQLQRQLSQAQSDQLGLQRAVTHQQTQEQATNARVQHLEVRTGFGAVRGPGIEVSVNSAPGADTSQLLRDSDLALLADALWSAGAEAMSVNGERLTVLSSFRNVGIGILVNSRPVNPPYVFDVIGNPGTLPADLLSSPAGGQWYALKASLGFRFDVRQGGTMTLPAAAPPHLRFAQIAGSDKPDTRTQGDSTS